jgi:DNA-binding CsgD family transcriptional regulator
LAQRLGIVAVGFAEQNWDFFLRMQLSYSYARGDAALSRSKEAVTQADWLTSMRAFATSDVGDILPRLNTPTLVLHARDQPFSSQEQAVAFTARAANARLVVIGGNPIGTGAEAVAAIERFLADLAPTSEETPRKGGARAAGLSAREVEVLRLIAAGKSNPQIAEALVISLNTVQRHVSNILAKTGAANRTEAAAYAHRNGLT